jgi:hypothetical protein
MFNNLFGWVGGLLSAIGSFFKHVYEWIVRHIIAQIIAKLTVVWNILNGILYPVVKFLRRLRAWYFKHIFPIQHAILEVISRVRVVLALLRLLGVKWAAKLDADLKKIAGYVTLSIQDVVATLNTIQSYLSLMLDPTMVLRKDFFAGTLFSSLGALKRATGYGSNTPLSASDAQNEANDKGLLNPATPFALTDASGKLQTTPAFDSIGGNFANAARDVGLPH